MNVSRSACFLCLMMLSSGAAFAQDAAPIRSQAVVNLTFDESSGPALDSASAGTAPDNGKLVNEPARVSSPFWNQSGKRAIQLDAGRAQYIEVADSPDVDRPDAVTVSLLHVNLTEPTDAAFHGLFAKRGQADGKAWTNYGINFIQQTDLAQVYVNDGTGYRAATYSAKEMLPVRRLSHLTVVLQVGDAPGNDTDTDADDVRIQVFVNGAAIAPKTAQNGLLDGTNAWLQNVQVAGLVNNVPVSIGRSETNIEYFSGVVDEFCLFPIALTPVQAKQLFHEVAGANVEDLIKQDQPAPASKPEIARINPPGLRIGQSTQINVIGKNLLPAPRLTVPVAGATIEIVGDAAADRLTAKVTLPDDAIPGIVPVFVQTDNGLSDAELVSADTLPLRRIESATAEQPAELPAAYWGNLQGGNVVRLDFIGKAGQRFVADVELRRLGGQAQPVLELKSAQGTPIEIAWGHSWLGGDARIEATLPTDGPYAIELHDLVYRAAGANSFRLKVGDLQLLDLPFPAAAAAGMLTVEPVGVGFAPGTRWTADFAPATNATVTPLPLPADVRVPGPRPVIRISDAASEVLEAAASAGELQTVNAALVGVEKRPMAINGRLRSEHERDRYLLQVTAGQRLRLTMQTESIGSPVDGEVAVLSHPGGNVLGMTGDQPLDSDSPLDFTVPENVTQVQVAVRDLLGRGGERAIYRLEIAPADRPVFALSVNGGAVSLAADGSAIVEVTLNRIRYGGSVALKIVGDDGLRIEPAEIPAGVSGKVMCRLSRSAPPQGSPCVLVQIIGSSVGVDPAVTCTAAIGAGATAPAFRDAVAAGAMPPGGLSMELVDPPAKLFRGVTQHLPVKLLRTPEMPAIASPVRFTSQTTEPVRRRQPLNPAAGNFPVVSVAPAQLATAGQEQFDVVVQTPLESVERSLQMVLTAEAVAHAYSDRVLATAHAVPFRAAIENAVAPKLDDASLKAVGDTSHGVTGKLQRTAGFTGPVEVTLVGLPDGYKVTPAVVTGDQEAFCVVVKAPKVEAEQAPPNVKLRVTSQGSLLIAEPAVALRVTPR